MLKIYFTRMYPVRMGRLLFFTFVSQAALSATRGSVGVNSVYRAPEGGEVKGMEARRCYWSMRVDRRGVEDNRVVVASESV